MASNHNGFDLVAIDLDGTLLRSDKRVGERSARAVREVVRRGVHVVLASARPPRGVKGIYQFLGLDSLQINYNGALVQHPAQGDHIHHQPLDAQLAARIVKTARQIDADVVVHVEILDRWYTDGVSDDLHVETSRSSSPDYLGPLDPILNQPVTKLMFLAQPERLDRVRARIAEQFTDEVAIAVSDAHVLQVVHRDVDKGHALAMIAVRLGVDQQRVMAIGDASNDVGMIRWAGLGIAVENAWQVAREAADLVVASNDNDGVARALEEHVLDG